MKTQNIVIITMTDGGRTVTEVTLPDFDSGTVFTGKGSSGLEPGDKPDSLTGEWLAQARALRSLAAHMERRAKGRINDAAHIKEHKAEIAARPKMKLEGASIPLYRHPIGTRYYFDYDPS